MVISGDKRQHAIKTNEKVHKRCFSTGHLIVVLFLVIALLILNPITRKRTTSLEKANSGHTRWKNERATFSNGLDSRAIHKADIDERIEMINMHTPLVSANEESICSSLDENMPLLLSILRGEEVQLYVDVNNDANNGGGDHRFATQSLIESDVNGYQIPFASDIRVVAPNPTSSEATGAKIIVIKGFNRDLIDRAFRKKHIYIVGDSTCRNLFVALRRILNYIQFGVAENQNETDSGISNARTLPDKYDDLNYDKWTAGLEILFFKAQKKWKQGDSLPPYMIPADRTYLRILDVTSLYFEPPEKKGEKSRKRKANLREEFIKLANETLVNADVVMFNAGLHLLHLIPVRQLSHLKYEGWNQYESILETLLQVSTDSEAPVILAKSTNRVCNSKFGPDYRRQASWYAENDEKTLKACQRTILNQQKSYKKHEEWKHGASRNITALSESQLMEICKDGTLSDMGSFRLNQRMSEFVERMRTTMPDRLRYFNDHDIELCNFTRGGDGRHYKEQVFVRLHLLAIMIDCMS